MLSIFKHPNAQQLKQQVEDWYAEHRQHYEENVSRVGPSLHLLLRGYAEILTTYRWLPTGDVELELEWFGPAEAPVRIPETLYLTLLRGTIKDGKLPEVVTALPWPLRMVEQSDGIIPLAAVYVRTDAEANPATYLYWRTFMLTRRAWRWLSLRLLLTLGIWGLLDWRANCERRWRDVFGPQRKAITRWLTS